MKQIAGWGNYPLIESDIHTPSSVESLRQLLSNSFTGIPRGMGRSYGDSSLATQTISTLALNHFISFDENTGLLHCYAGVTLASILDVFAAKGWFLSVTPGTKFVTVGGAIASDVHGKNHHLDGSFCDHLISFRMITANGEMIQCSRDENYPLFKATCGGMGLTGIIIEARFVLKAIKSTYIKERTIQADNLLEAMELFEENKASPYSVAWIDCLSTGRKLGRSLIILGEHAEDNRFDIPRQSPISVPFNIPDFILNPFTTNLFTHAYYNRVFKKYTTQLNHYETYFYPLDGIHQWNKIYGKRGFLQYQFVLPKEAGFEGMNAILQKIAASHRGSFLSVLKAFKKSNENLLSFPMEGYTLALDFKLYDGLFKLLDNLDEIVLSYGGRIYLTKDSRMSEKIFKQSYPNWEEFNEIRQQFGADKTFQSNQSKRLGL